MLICTTISALTLQNRANRCVFRSRQLLTVDSWIPQMIRQWIPDSCRLHC